MKNYTMETAAADFDELMEHAQQGLVVNIIGSDGREYELKLKPLPPKKPRKAGLFKGKIKITDEFYEPLPEFKPYME
ncbi:MAG: type II toxin-antitoxin system prevent-host-death family antitoxin [Anaerolineae bacterium]|nr:type II toxin-antitoxin system prevent-host-death family antitoxin [Anaerolineae bacterium]